MMQVYSVCSCGHHYILWQRIPHLISLYVKKYFLLFVLNLLPISFIGCLAVDTFIMAAGPQRMANETMWFIPKNAVISNIIHAGQVIPGFVIQPGMATQPVGQEPGSHNNQTQQKISQGLQKFLKVETKTLGTIQIMIGLIHIGFGGVAAVLYNTFYYVSLTTLVGYPFWGGLFFIGSGSLSVSAEKYLSCCWVKYTVGMNITSAVMALIGIVLYITDMTVNPENLENDAEKLCWTFGLALDVTLSLFSLLEFCIAASTAHFGRKAACYNNDQAMVVVPCAASGHGVASDKVNPAPPAYNDMAPSH